MNLMRLPNIIILSITTIITNTSIAVPPPSGYDPDPILDAIRKVETGGHKDPRNAVGDGGRAIGPYQIHRSYWQDAVEFDPSIGGTYQDCKDEEYARRIIIAYWTRYSPSWNPETLARVHNGGPRGSSKKATVKYWQKVQQNLPKSVR